MKTVLEIIGTTYNLPPLPLLPSEPAGNPVKPPGSREVEPVQVDQLTICPIANLKIGEKETKFFKGDFKSHHSRLKNKIRVKQLRQKSENPFPERLKSMQIGKHFAIQKERVSTLKTQFSLNGT